MNNVFLQIKRQVSGVVPLGSNLIFDTIVYTFGNINYDLNTGFITINEPGTYSINWWVATQASLSTNGAVFAIDSSQGDFIEGNSPIKTGEVYGIAIIEVVSLPITISLKNSSTADIFLSTIVPVTANLVVIKEDIIGIIGPTGPTGPAGPTGPTGPTGSTELTE
jgi:hypothetical protein